MTIRRVRGNGGIKWRGETIYLSEALRGEPVGLRPSDDRHWSIQFGPLIIGLLTITPNELCIPLQKCYLCARSKCHPCAQSYRCGRIHHANSPYQITTPASHTLVHRRQPA